jgi:YebC/PmpR family DNA-binding regulatory protein
MSGHSKWSTIKHRKAAQDAKRGAAFNKIIRELVVAAREGGGDLRTNASLATWVDKSRAAGMPKETMERAIQRGAGAGSGEHYERSTYEGRGPGGVALIVMTLSDNRNRTVADVRHTFAKFGGQMAENGSVSWLFERRAVINIKGGNLTDDALLEACAEAGAEDYRIDDEEAEIYAQAADFATVREWFAKSGKYNVDNADLAMVPKETVEITEEDVARKLLRLIEALEDHDDVQIVYSNWSMSDELVEKAVS